MLDVGFRDSLCARLPQYSPTPADTGVQGTVLTEYGDFDQLDWCLRALAEIAEFLSGQDLEDASLESIEPAQIYDQGMLRQHGLFVGTVGHAICFVGYERVEHQGREVLALKMVNSWSKQWGRSGTVLWLADAFNAMRRHRWTEIGGVSGVKLGPQAEIPDWQPSLSGRMP